MSDENIAQPKSQEANTTKFHDAKVLRDETFGSFHLGRSEFAISVKSIQEVVNPPTEYTSIPLSPDHMLGMFNLRGMIVPVIDLVKLMGIERGSIDLTLQKIAIIECGSSHFGLLIDQTSEILKRGTYERFDFNKVEGHSHSDFISGAFKLDNGKRIIQIIDAEALAKIPGLAQHLSDDSQKNAQQKKNRGPRKQCISFVVGPSTCAMSIESIQEIIKVDHIHESALAVGNCIGTIDLRGITVGVVDFAALLNYRPADHSAEATQRLRRIVVMKMGTEFFGLLVDGVKSIVSYFADELLSFPTTQDQKMFAGCISRPDEEEILLLEPARILSDQLIQDITHGHSMLYNSVKAATRGKADKSVRRTFITFKLNNHFAVSISEVREIIDLPSTLLEPPGLAKHFQGVLNLRGTLVAVADGRMLYSMAPQERTGREKILIFEDGESKYGLTVDSVEAIVSFDDTDKIKLPPILYRNNTDTASEDVREAVECDCGVKDEAGRSQRSVLMMLSLDSLAKRIASEPVIENKIAA